MLFSFDAAPAEDLRRGQAVYLCDATTVAAAGPEHQAIGLVMNPASGGRVDVIFFGACGTPAPAMPYRAPMVPAPPRSCHYCGAPSPGRLCRYCNTRHDW